MHLDLPLCPKTTARITLASNGQQYHLVLTVRGLRHVTAGLSPDLLLAPEGGGSLMLRPVGPGAFGITDRSHWSVVYQVCHEQVVLMAIYPMTRLTLAPWTGPGGVCLDDRRSRRGLMFLARNVLGLPIEQPTGDLP